ncbi:MAG: helix-turn-helix transcriptional regulator [Thermoproteota archaeon]
MIASSFLNEVQYLLAFVSFLGIVDKIWRKASKKDNDIELDLKVVRNRIDWAAYEAEVANLRSEVIIRKLSELETEISKIKDYLATALEVSLELDRKLREVIILNRTIPNKFIKKSIDEKQDVKETRIAEDKFSSTEEKVIELLSLNEGIAAREIQIKLNMSREHISRLLGRLVNKGIVLRSRRGRQFVYRLQQQTLVNKKELS